MEEIVFKAIGTTISLAIDHDQAPVVLAEARRRLLDYEKRFSANNSDSLLMQVNAKAGISPVQVDPDIFQLIATGKDYSLQSGATLNIAIGPWSNYGGWVLKMLTYQVRLTFKTG